MDICSKCDHPYGENCRDCVVIRQRPEDFAQSVSNDIEWSLYIDGRDDGLSSTPEEQAAHKAAFCILRDFLALAENQEIAKKLATAIRGYSTQKWIKENMCSLMDETGLSCMKSPNNKCPQCWGHKVLNKG